MKRHIRTEIIVFIISITLIYITFFTLIEGVGLTITSITGFVVENQPPQITNIPDLTIDEDSSTLINLNIYVSDDLTNDSDISWSYSQPDNLLISINQDNIARISARANWNGQENTTLTAIDTGGLSDSDDIRVTITPTNDPVEIVYFDPSSLNPIVEETIETDFEIEAEDIDNDNLTFKWYLDDSLKSYNDSIWYYTPSSNETGNHKVKVIVSDGEFDATHSWNITVIRLNTNPILIKNIPNQTWDMNTNITDVFDLDEHFDDPQNQSLTYSFEGNENIIIRIDFSNNNASFYPKNSWFGTETIRFIADDGNLIAKSNDIILRVNEVIQEVCNELWNCTRWQPEECIEGTQTRNCYDLNNCGTTARKPSETRVCVYMPKENKTAVQTTRDIVDTKTTTTTEEILFSPLEALKRSKTLSFIIGIFIVTGLLAVVGFEQSKSKKKLDKEKKSRRIETGSLLKLTDYIRRELQEGFSEEQIKSKLLYEGWNNYIIKKAFSSLALIKSSAQKESGIESMIKKEVRPSRKEIQKDLKNKLKAFEV